MTEHRPYLCLATAALAAGALLCLAGCKTPPPTTAAPMYGASTVAPPATGMVGQPAPFGTYAPPQQAAAYPPPPSAPMPGPATSWQGVTQPATAPTNGAPTNTWSWAQPNTGAPAAQQPSAQQYANQYTQQANQYANQMQNQANQYVNQTQQQMNNQLQNTTNQYQQSLNNQVNQYNNQLQQGMQNTQQQFNQQVQQAMPQMQSGPTTQTVNGNWWPFSDTSAMPPARATPTAVPKY